MGGKNHACQIQLGSLTYLKRSTENTLTEILLVTISLSGFTTLEFLELFSHSLVLKDRYGHVKF